MSRKYRDFWQSDERLLLCAPSLAWQWRTPPGPFWRKPVPGWWLTTVPTTSCYCACVCAQGWLYPLTLPAFLQQASGFLTSTLYFVFPEISSPPFPVAPNFSLHFFFHFLRSISWCCCHPWQRSIAIWVFMLRPFKLVLCKNTYLAQETLFPCVLENQTNLYSTKEWGNPQDHGLFEVKLQLNLLSFALWCLLQLL